MQGPEDGNWTVVFVAGDAVVARMSDTPAAELTREEAEQVATVLDVCLERGFDVDGVDTETLERARARLTDAD